MSRIDLSDNAQSALMKMAEGNPGAINVLIRLFQGGPAIDPDCGLGGFGPILNLDSFGIYGSRIWMLYKDVCGENIVKTHACLRAVQLGILSEHALNEAIDGHRIDVAEIVAGVRKQLPNFAFSE